MFNTYNNATHNTLKINAVSGGIYKTYKESWFRLFNLGSQLAGKLFRKGNCRYWQEYNSYSIDCSENAYKYGKEVIVLQMVICGDMEVIAEIMYKEDFDKYFIDESIGGMECEENEN